MAHARFSKLSVQRSFFSRRNLAAEAETFSALEAFDACADLDTGLISIFAEADAPRKGQTPKGAANMGEASASLKRCPDTNPLVLQQRLAKMWPTSMWAPAHQSQHPLTAVRLLSAVRLCP
jgi:hypothetical protein